MPLNKKYTCSCKLFPEDFAKRGYKTCPFCLDRGWNLYPINVDSYKGVYTKAVIWTDEPNGKTDIEKYRDDIWVKITCECGDEVSFSEWGQQVCKCGRVYKLSGDVEKDDTYKGNFEYWKKEWKMYDGESE